MFSLPVSLPEVYGGFAEAHGIIRFDGVQLTLEFEIQDGVFGVVKSGVKEIRLPVSEIAAITFKRKTFRALIVLRCHRVKSVEKIPGQKGGEFRIQVKRAHRDEAEAFASALRLAVAEARLDALRQEGT